MDYFDYNIKLGRILYKFIYKFIFISSTHKGFIRGKNWKIFLIKKSLLLVKANFLIEIFFFGYNKIYLVCILNVL